MPTLSQIEAALAEHQPTLLESRKRAAVAVLLREQAQGPEVLFIKRAEFEGDPWSGHMAFPGGGVELEDAHPAAAAIRETHEEVGLDVAGARELGRLDDLKGRGDRTELVVSAHVFDLGAGPPEAPSPNHEVQEAFWFPLVELLNDERHVDYRHPQVPVDFPGILVGQPDRHVVWGLTYRFLEEFLTIVGRPLPKRWIQDPDGHLQQVER